MARARSPPMTATPRLQPGIRHRRAVARAAPVPASPRGGQPARRGSRHEGRSGGCADRGRAVPRVPRRGPPARRLGGQLRRQHRHPGEPRHPQGGPGDPGRPRPAGDRRRPERHDRLRRRQRVRRRHPDQRGHRKARPAGPGRPRPLGPGGSRPHGKTLYVADAARAPSPRSTTAAPGKPGAPIPVGRDPRAIALTPGGRDRLRAQLAERHGHPDRHRDRPGRAPRSASAPFPVAFAFRPGRRDLYVASFGGDTVIPIDTATGRPGRPDPAGYARTRWRRHGTGLYAVDGNSDQVTRLGPARPEPRRLFPGRDRGQRQPAYVVNTIDSHGHPAEHPHRAGGPSHQRRRLHLPDGDRAVRDHCHRRRALRLLGRPD